MQWITKLPNWIKGVIGLITLIITFIVLFLQNIHLSVTVTVAIAVIAAFFSSLYVAISRKRSEVWEGHTFRFPNRQRHLALAILILVPILVALLLINRPSRSFVITAFVGTATPTAQTVALVTPISIDTATPTPTATSTPVGMSFYVYRDDGSPDNHFSFWEGGIWGNGESVGFGGQIDYGHSSNCRMGNTCMSIFRTPASREPYWVGIHWLHPQGNTGSINAGFNLEKAERLTFWARAERGGETVTFGMGGMGRDADTCDPLPEVPYPDSACATMISPTLSTTWQQYSIDLVGKDLGHVITGFLVSTGVGYTQTIYLDEIRYESEPPTPMPTATFTPTSTSTATPTPTPTPVPKVAVLSLMASEREAVLTENKDLIRAIFAPNATKTDAQTGESWNAIERYEETFQTEDHLQITHTNVIVVISDGEATVVNDSCGSFLVTTTGGKSDYNCPQCNQWTFQRDASGRWWITNMTYGLTSTAPSHSYTFEDGTNGCWVVRYDAGEPQGQMTTFTTERAYQGQGSLHFAFDLAQVSKHRGQTIRYNMPFAGYASAYVYAPPDAPADLEAGFFAMELDHDPFNYHQADQLFRLTPGRWTPITWRVIVAGWEQPLHLLGIEVRQVGGGGSYSGYVLIDEVFIQSQ